MTSEQTRQLITDLLYEPSETVLLDELESIKTILNPKTPISWLKETLSQELWEEEIFQGGDVPLPQGLQTIWDRLSRHLGFSRQIPAGTIRTWRLSLMSGNTECSGCCGAWLRASCLECGSPRCSFSFCSDFLKPCTTCQAIPPSCSQEQDSHRGPAQPSINMHQVGELFIEAITEVAYDPVVAEALDQGRTEDSIHLAQDMRFKAVIRGWSHQEQQTRANALLRLNDISMTREMQESHDLILLPASWWPSAVDTLDPDELGWWYRVSEPIRFKECKACGKRIGEDMPAKHRGCLKCPVGKFKHATSIQGYLCVSSDPRRVG